MTIVLSARGAGCAPGGMGRPPPSFSAAIALEIVLVAALSKVSFWSVVGLAGQTGDDHSFELIQVGCPCCLAREIRLDIAATMAVELESSPGLATTGAFHTLVGSKYLACAGAANARM